MQELQELQELLECWSAGTTVIAQSEVSSIFW
jgi:hypothetical protein